MTVDGARETLGAQPQGSAFAATAAFWEAIFQKASLSVVPAADFPEVTLRGLTARSRGCGNLAAGLAGRDRLSSPALAWSIEAPPHRDRRRVENQNTEDRGVGRRNHDGVVRGGDPAGKPSRKRQRDISEQGPARHPPSPTQRFVALPLSS